MPPLCDSYRRVPGTRQNYSLAPFPKDKKPRPESRSLLHKSKSLESRLLLPSEVIGSQGTILPLLLWSPALGWPCSWHLLLHFHKLLATPCWGFANGRPLSAAPSCFFPAVCESRSSREHELMPSTKNDFHQLRAMRLCSGGCRTKGQKGGESWPQWQMESGPGGCRVPSSISRFSFNLLLSRADQLEL